MDIVVYKADWLALRTLTRCEIAILPLWDIPGFSQQDGWRRLGGDRGVELEFGLCTHFPRDSGPLHGMDSQH